RPKPVASPASLPVRRAGKRPPDPPPRAVLVTLPPGLLQSTHRQRAERSGPAVLRRRRPVGVRVTGHGNGEAPMQDGSALGGCEEQYRLLMECVTDFAIFFLD